MAAQHFLRFLRQSRCTFTVISRLVDGARQTLSDSRFAIRNVTLHLVDVDLSFDFCVLLALCLSVHVEIHDVFRDHLRGTDASESMLYPVKICESHTRSRVSLCSSLTMKIISNLDKIVVWKSIFCARSGY